MLFPESTLLERTQSTHVWKPLPSTEVPLWSPFQREVDNSLLENLSPTMPTRPQSQEPLLEPSMCTRLPSCTMSPSFFTLITAKRHGFLGSMASLPPLKNTSRPLGSLFSHHTCSIFPRSPWKRTSAFARATLRNLPRSASFLNSNSESLEAKKMVLTTLMLIPLVCIPNPRKFSTPMNSFPRSPMVPSLAPLHSVMSTEFTPLEMLISNLLFFTTHRNTSKRRLEVMMTSQ